LDELVRRYSEGAGIEPVRLRLRDLPTDTRTALADLLGSDRLPSPSVAISIRRLQDALGWPAGVSLRPVIERLRGPLDDRRARRLNEQRARDDLWAWLATQAATLDLGTGPGRLGRWLADQQKAGARGGAGWQRVRLNAALRVLRALPADGVSLAAFASDHADDPHALDHGRSLAGIVLDAVSCAFEQDRTSDAESARALWETVGVVPDPVSSTVLALGLPGEAASPLGSWLAATAAIGEPVVLTLANLRRWPVTPLPSHVSLLVVENPSLVIEAAALRWDGSPLVCSSGRPSVAVVTLLRQLTAQGATAYQHADCDPAGLAITAWMTHRAGTVPWRMGADHYNQHASGAADIAGPIPRTPWDPRLQSAMERARVAVYEEQVRHDLLNAARTIASGT
jgi:uncharacterized protein (TIGR02679 family)